MRYFVAPDQINEVAPNLMEHLIDAAGLGIQYKQNPGEINKHFTVGKLIDLINKHINDKYHINSIIRQHDGWTIDSYAYSKKLPELVDALWASFRWCYDYKQRTEEIKQMEDVWNKKEDKELVDVKRI